MKKIALLLCLLLFAQAAFANTVNLSWNRNAETNCVGYNVYRSTSSGQYSATNKVNTAVVAQVASGGTPAFVDATAPAAKVFYVVTAVNTDGLESVFSNEVSADLKAPAAPTGLKIQSISTASLVIEGTTVATAAIGDPLQFQIPRLTPPRSYMVQVLWDRVN